MTHPFNLFTFLLTLLLLSSCIKKTDATNTPETPPDSDTTSVFSYDPNNDGFYIFFEEFKIDLAANNGKILAKYFFNDLKYKYVENSHYIRTNVENLSDAFYIDDDPNYLESFLQLSPENNYTFIKGDIPTTTDKGSASFCELYLSSLEVYDNEIKDLTILHNSVYLLTYYFHSWDSSWNNDDGIDYSFTPPCYVFRKVDGEWKIVHFLGGAG